MCNTTSKYCKVGIVDLDHDDQLRVCMTMVSERAVRVVVHCSSATGTEHIAQG